MPRPAAVLTWRLSGGGAVMLQPGQTRPPIQAPLCVCQIRRSLFLWRAWSGAVLLLTGPVSPLPRSTVPAPFLPPACPVPV
jgi:hypothetical protein